MKLTLRASYFTISSIFCGAFSMRIVLYYLSWCVPVGLAYGSLAAGRADSNVTGWAFLDYKLSAFIVCLVADLDSIFSASRAPAVTLDCATDFACCRRSSRIPLPRFDGGRVA